jgi:hypothetical protein
LGLAGMGSLYHELEVGGVVDEGFRAILKLMTIISSMLGDSCRLISSYRCAVLGASRRPRRTLDLISFSHYSLLYYLFPIILFFIIFFPLFSSLLSFSHYSL